MKKAPFTSRKIFPGIVALVGLWLAYELCLHIPATRDLIWRHELVSALDEAVTVKVVEHSNTEDQIRVGHPPKIYATVTLDAGQIAKLRQLFSQVSDETPTFGVSQCLFDEHHYVEMTAKDGRTRTVLLCFECGQYYLGNTPDDQWTYSQLGEMSQPWKRSMSHFITSLGLHPDGPWWGPDAVGK